VHHRLPPDTELVWDSFHQVVNMTSEELREWLLTAASGEEAFSDRPGLGLPELGEKVVRLLRKRKVDLTPEDTEVMQQVADFVTEQEESPPPAGPADDAWRRSLMTVGHDPLRA
jgi:ethanolamine ammonia-lyase large subunit